MRQINDLKRAFVRAVMLLVTLASMASAQASLTPEEARTIAKEAYIFNFPLVMMYRTMYLQAIDATSKSYSGGFGLLEGKKVTCAHNVICDVENAGGLVQYTGQGDTADTFVDGDLVTGKHPAVIDAFTAVLLREIEPVTN